MPRRVFIALAVVLALALPGTALAHERRDVGKYQLVVGWSTEPALVGEPNGVDLRITDRGTGQPVQGAEQGLRVAVQFGGGPPGELPLRARFGQPGAYTADVIPTRAGSYVFTFRGQVEAETLEERFESGPGRFNDVEPLDRLQFPEAVPSTGDLQRELRAAEARAEQATTLAYAGGGLGLLGAALGLTALLRRPGRPSR